MIFVFEKVIELGFRRFIVKALLLVTAKVRSFCWAVFFSDNRPDCKDTKIISAVQFRGRGVIKLTGVTIGVMQSPKLLSGSSYIEARNTGAIIEIGCGTHINNNAVIIADKTKIKIGSNCLIGPDFFITDSDFHGLSVEDRRSGVYQCSEVVVLDNVFIGAGVRVLKGVVIGENSVLASGSVVVNDIEPNSIYAGVPAKKVKDL